MGPTESKITDQTSSSLWRISKPHPERITSRTILVLLTTGHFVGGAGSRAFLRNHREDIFPQVVASITVEHVGAKDWAIALDGSTPSTGLMEPAVVFSPRKPTFSLGRLSAALLPESWRIISGPALESTSKEYRHRFGMARRGRVSVEQRWAARGLPLPDLTIYLTADTEPFRVSISKMRREPLDSPHGISAFTRAGGKNSSSPPGD